jgi:hypothetical protein
MAKKSAAKTSTKKSISSISSQTWQAYLESNETFSNKKLRTEGMSFLDAMLSKEADFTQTPKGKRIAKVIRDL